MNVRQREGNFRDVGEFLQHCFAHRIKRVLNGKAIVFGKSFENHLPNAAPSLPRRRVRVCVTPNRFDGSRKNSVCRLRQSRVLVFDEADKTRPCCLA